MGTYANTLCSVRGVTQPHLAFEGADTLLELDMSGAHVVTEAFLMVEVGLRLLELSVQPRQLLLF